MSSVPRLIEPVIEQRIECRMGRRLRRRVGALTVAVMMVPMMSWTPAIAQRPVPPTSIACQGAAILPADHPDLKALRSLLQRNRLSFQVDLGGSVSRYELAIALDVLWHELNRQGDGQRVLSPADRGTLERLQQIYAPERNARKGGASGSMALPGAGKISQPMPLSGAIPPASVISPSPMANQELRRAPVGRAAPAPATAPPLNRPMAGSPPIFSDRTRPELLESGNTEGYNLIDENPFFQPKATPLSTFSIDVDTAAYSNVRRFLNQGQLPPPDAVRIEELINYFTYDYPQPQGDLPFSVTTEVSRAPWNAQHKLVQIGLKGKQLQTLQPSNLVFLVDVSGSMGQPNKLPLVKQSLCLLVNELSAQDRVTLVVYAGNAGVVLPPTAGDRKAQIMTAIDNLEAGGSTAGGEGIQLAYKLAQQSFLKQGNNRVILATDGDFNVGVSSDAELVRLIEQKRDRGIFLTVLGFGTGNYKDSKMEQLADKGNGNYAYIDTLMEARKVLVNDLRGTLFAIAKDVKIQVEFNPAKVQAYRLIGYENRLLKDQDFNNDQKDAGEIGAGHSVTALYEIIPTGMVSDVKLPPIDPLKYQRPSPTSRQNNGQGSDSSPDQMNSQSGELLNVKLRYKDPNQSTSQLITQPVLDTDRTASTNLQFSSAVAMFGFLLRDSEFKGTTTVDVVLQLANQSKGSDRHGYRAEFIRLVQRYQALQPQKPADKASRTNADQP
jgi:Ca-activated chloride channel homolog